MVMVINEPASNPNRTLDSFKTLAATAQGVTPGGGAGGAAGGAGGGAAGGAGGSTGGDQTGSTGGTTPTGTEDAAQATISTAGAGVLTVPGGVRAGGGGCGSACSLRRGPSH
ncbi:predicted protein [Chaetomium globosum CBS 148.51]|uniref:Uncharacterized protein n=1 Tax=Chaetomium globosum (strain ATCC 6205 / CBS 148.51 / DSM 1962 / NBRC 6347 / NRRL 1970) TaxID=306901 RepID=Q2GNB0_CHAGB|nr:uncharacterized protein CHGG_10544 [Chaetomium globosum CBS 148.51]EAQ84140.1 predicted protein [Chaetomium globosum CBS 148.51]